MMLGVVLVLMLVLERGQGLVMSERKIKGKGEGEKEIIPMLKLERSPVLNWVLVLRRLTAVVELLVKLFVVGLSTEEDYHGLMMNVVVEFDEIVEGVLRASIQA